MKKRQLKLNKAAIAAVTLPVLPVSEKHGVTIIDPEARTMWGALGISKDRTEELLQDVIESAKTFLASLRGKEGVKALTKPQLIALATQYAQTDNEIALAIDTISTEYGEQALDSLSEMTTDQIISETEDQISSSSNVNTNDELTGLDDLKDLLSAFRERENDDQGVEAGLTNTENKNEEEL